MPFKKTLADLSKEERVEFARKGGKAKKGLPNPHFTRCANCSFKIYCPYAYWEYKRARKKIKEADEEGRKAAKKYIQFEKPDSKCYYEIYDKLPEKEKDLALFDAFVGNDPKQLLAKIGEIYGMLEQQTKDKPNAGRVQQLYYALMQLYKVKFGENAAQILISNQINSTNTSKDIKEIQAEIRKELTRQTDSGEETLSYSVSKKQTAVADEEEEEGEREEVAKLLEG